MGALVGVMESRFLDGFEVTDRTAGLLVVHGWTAPRIESEVSPVVAFQIDNNRHGPSRHGDIGYEETKGSEIADGRPTKGIAGS